MNIYTFANFEFIKICHMQKDTKIQYIIENTVHNVILLLHLKNIVKANYLNSIFFHVHKNTILQKIY